MAARILVGHVLDRLRELPAESVHCVVTSPPYYGLRDYGIEPQVWDTGKAWCEYGTPGGHEWGDPEPLNMTSGLHRLPPNQTGGTKEYEAHRGQDRGNFCLRCGAWRGSLGLEPTLALYLDHMTAVFREVRRVMRKDATCWLNIGDSYCASPPGNKTVGVSAKSGLHGVNNASGTYRETLAGGTQTKRDTTKAGGGLKPKDLMMVPARLAIRLQDDGWWVRSDICWAKRAPMPESCTDRPTSAWEHVFLLTKSARYYYDAEAVKEEAEGEASGSSHHHSLVGTKDYHGGRTADFQGYRPAKRNQRNVWLLGPEPFPEAHFATFPTEIPRRAILAGTKPGDTVLDPFLGSGTTALVADRLARDCIGIELSEEYAAMARRRIGDDAPLFAEVAD